MLPEPLPEDDIDDPLDLLPEPDDDPLRFPLPEPECEELAGGGSGGSLAVRPSETPFVAVVGAGTGQAPRSTPSPLRLHGRNHGIASKRLFQNRGIGR